MSRGKGNRISPCPKGPQSTPTSLGPLAMGRWPMLLIPFMMLYFMPVFQSKKKTPSLTRKKKRIPVATEGGQVCFICSVLMVET